MEFEEYQRLALTTDQVGMQREEDGARIDILVPLLGLAGETGEILAEYKKYLRDGPSHKLFKERFSEELGDLLWYLSNCATKFGLSLDAVASQNLSKCQARWEHVMRDQAKFPISAFDADFHPGECLPRGCAAELSTVEEDGVVRSICVVEGRRFGDPLTDNRYEDDGYRFHDVLHLAHAGVLGWSPIVRAFLKRKRKSKPRVDEVEDGGRAIAIEEGVAAMVFSFAERHFFLEGIDQVDYELLRNIKSMTSHLEVGQCSAGQWESAILQGFAVWREVRRLNGGRVLVNLDTATIRFSEQGAEVDG